MRDIVLRKDTLYDMAAYIGKPVTSSLVFVNKFFMVITKEVQYRRLKIVNMNRIFDNIISQFVCFSINDSRFYSSSGHPDAKATGMMIAAIITVLKGALAIVGPAKFATPDYQCFVQHAPVFQVLYQCSRSLINVLGKLPGSIGQIRMSIPTHMVKLNEANTSLGETPGEQTICCKRAWLK